MSNTIRSGFSRRATLTALIGTLGWITYTRGAARLGELDVLEYSALTALAAWPLLLVAALAGTLLGWAPLPGADELAPTWHAIVYTGLVHRAGEEKFWALSQRMAGQGRSASGPPAPRGGTAPGSVGDDRGSGSGATASDPVSAAKRSSGRRRVPIWIIAEDKLLRPVIVRLGLTDGAQTEVVEGKLKQGDRIVVGVEMEPNHTSPATSTRPPGFGGAPMGGRGTR